MKKRVFLAIDLPGEIKKAFFDFFKNVQKIDVIKWEKLEKLHLTLIFLGFVEEEKIQKLAPLLKDIGVRESPLTLSILPQLSSFPTITNPRVLWLPIQGDIEILQKITRSLQGRLQEEGFQFDKRPFSAHLTLGRFREGSKKWEKEKAIRAIKEKLPKFPLEFKVEGITLFESKLTRQGSVYQVLSYENFRH